MSTEGKIRLAADRKIRVRLSTRSRSTSGFVVCVNGDQTWHPTRREALSNMLARVRCLERIDCTLKPARKEARQ
jgi:hypothetical protein